MKRGAGFTLIELLVALTLASLVAMLAYGALHVTLRSWQAAEQRQQQMELRGLTQDLLRRLLESPQTLSLRDREGVRQVAFYGDETQLVFVARLPVLDDSEQFYWVQLAQDKQLDGDGLSWQLQMRYLPFFEVEALDWALLIDSLVNEGEQQLLAQGLRTPWQFGYLEQLADGEQTWRERWQQRPGLPLLLRLSPSGLQRGLSGELLVAPRNLAYAIVSRR